jgi:fatty acyl-CoA reductase
MSAVPGETHPGASAASDAIKHRPTVQRLDGRLRDLLAGKKIVMTGVTGFIGEHLLW